MIAEQLRKSILQAAIQGKLTEQLPEDGDARDLLKEIQKEKDQLIKEGKIKKEKPLPEISEDEIPFEIPDNWCWVRLGNIFDIARGGSPRPIKAFLTTNSDGINWIKISDTDIGGKFINETKEKIIPEGIKKSRLVNPGDLLLTNSMSFGRPYISNTRGCIHDGWLVLSPLSEEISKEYFYHLLTTEFIYMTFANTVAGAVVKNLNSDKVRYIAVPLPPISEQKRIVDRLEKLIPEVDKLKYDETKLEALYKSFPKKMKDSILKYAIQGKLTEQLESDGDARDLLKEIQKEKERLVKEGKIKREKPLPEITEDEIPFDIPENWCWVRLGDIGEIVGGGTPKTEDKRNWQDATIPWLTPADMKYVIGKYVSRGERLISKYGLLSSSAKLMPKGTVLFSSRAPIGYLAIAENPICTNQGFKSVVPYYNEMNEYIYYYLMAVTNEIEKLGSGTTFKEVSGSVVKNVLIPLPPMNEQQRIVEFIEQLLPLCDALE